MAIAMIHKSLIVAVAMALVSLSSTTIVAGNDCPRTHRNMTMEAACREAMLGKPMAMYKLCMGTLGQARIKTLPGSIHEASEYAYITAVEADLDYVLTLSPVSDARRSSSIPSEDKAVYELCYDDYGKAYGAMDRTSRKLDKVWRRLPRLPERCGLDLGDEYKTALRSVEACRDRLAKLPDLQLVGMAKSDYNKTMVAYLLSKLIGVK